MVKLLVVKVWSKCGQTPPMVKLTYGQNTTYGQSVVKVWSNLPVVKVWSKCCQTPPMVKLPYGQSVVKPHLWSNLPMVKTPVVKPTYGQTYLWSKHLWSNPPMVNPTYVQSPLGSNHAMVKALPSKAKKRSHTSTNRISTYKTFIPHFPK